MLALAFDDFTVAIVDTETRRTVRKFTGHRGNITDMVGLGLVLGLGLGLDLASDPVLGLGLGLAPVLRFVNHRAVSGLLSPRAATRGRSEPDPCSPGPTPSRVGLFWAGTKTKQMWSRMTRELLADPLLRAGWLNS